MTDPKPDCLVKESVSLQVEILETAFEYHQTGSNYALSRLALLVTAAQQEQHNNQNKE